MKETFLATLSPMLVMFSCIALGFLLRRLKAMPENGATVLSRLEINVLMPALVVNTFMTYCTVESVTQQYPMVLYGLLATLLTVAIAAPLSRLFARDAGQRKIYRYSLMLANFGFLGNAIVPQIMGPEAMYSYMLFTIPLNILLYAWAFGSLIPEGKGQKKSLLQNLANPTCIAMVAGILLGLTGAGALLPSFVTSTLGNLAGCMGPVAMILTGFVIGGYKMRQLLTNKRVYIAAFLRLLVLPAVIVGVLWLLGADNTTLYMALFAFSAALGLNTVVVPAAYDGDTTTGAGMAMISHGGCIITIPLLYALLGQLLG